MSALLLLTLLGCSPSSPSTPSQQPQRGDVVVIVLDTLRADVLGQYGYPLPTSPGLDRLARTSTRFEEAYAPSPWTVPSTSTILTGLHPLRHGLRHPGDVMPDALHTLAERLQGAGWRTGGFSHNISIAPKNRYDQGFDTFETYSGEVLAYPHVYQMTRAARTWLGEHPSPAFVYLQPMNCHGPYKVPEGRRTTVYGRVPKVGFRYYGGPMRQIMTLGNVSARLEVTEDYRASLREKYDTAVRYATDEVGKFLRYLEKQGRYDDALIVLTADHGEELYDHQGFSHGYSLHREVLHVPLFVKLPGQKEARVVSGRVSLADVVPTVLEAVSVEVGGDPLDGRSLVGAARGEAIAAQPLLFDVDWGRRIVGSALLDGPWKLVRIERNYEGLADVTRLYDVVGDPLETFDLALTNEQQVTTMRAALDTLVVATTSGAQPANVLSEMDQAQLEALGYLEAEEGE